MALDAGQLPALWALASARFYVTYKTQAAVGNLAHSQPSDVIVCAEMDTVGIVVF